MTSYQVTRSRKDWYQKSWWGDVDSFRYITHVEVNGKIWTKEYAVMEVMCGRWQLYTRDYWGNRAEVRVQNHQNGRPYLITEADGSGQNNLLNLPDC